MKKRQIIRQLPLLIGILGLIGTVTIVTSCAQNNNSNISNTPSSPNISDTNHKYVQVKSDIKANDFDIFKNLTLDTVVNYLFKDEQNAKEFILTNKNQLLSGDLDLFTSIDDISNISITKSAENILIINFSLKEGHSYDENDNVANKETSYQLEIANFGSSIADPTTIFDNGTIKIQDRLSNTSLIANDKAITANQAKNIINGEFIFANKDNIFKSNRITNKEQILNVTVNKRNETENDVSVLLSKEGIYDEYGSPSLNDKKFDFIISGFTDVTFDVEYVNFGFESKESDGLVSDAGNVAFIIEGRNLPLDSEQNYTIEIKDSNNDQITKLDLTNSDEIAFDNFLNSARFIFKTQDTYAKYGGKEWIITIDNRQSNDDDKMIKKFAFSSPTLDDIKSDDFTNDIELRPIE